jgi:tetratricopeptide (TPR) repeat protein
LLSFRARIGQALLVESRQKEVCDLATIKEIRKAQRNVRRPETKSLGVARDWLLALALVLATVMAYHPVWRAGFIWDDDAYVTRNPLLTAADGLRRIWFSLDSPSQYFPLTYTTFYLEHLLWGFNPAGYHAVNLLFHAANALLVWRLLARLRLPGAWLAAALFALHPVQVESVAWITELKNVLMGFFFLLSLLAWTRFIDDTAKRPWRFYALALVFYALALAAKTTACSLPAALLLVLWLKKMPIGRRRLAQVAPFMALGIGMGLVTVWWERYHQGTQGAVFSIGPVERVLIASRALWFYAGKLLWPVNLTFSYPRWTISASDPFAYGWLLATVALGVVIWRARRWLGRSAEVAVVFFAATLSPVLGFFMLWTFYFTFVADHYQYLACLGPLALAAAGTERGFGWVARRTPLLQPVCCAVLLTFLGALTCVQCRQYANAETLWRATLATNPRCWMAHNNLGAILFDQGKMEEAAEHVKMALDAFPDYAEARKNLGMLLYRNGQVPEAIAQFRKALELRPNHADAHNILGIALGQEEEAAEAITQFRMALDLRSDQAECHNNLGLALSQRGELMEAIEQFREALKIQPDYAQANNNLTIALNRQGEAMEAIAQSRKVLEVQPDNGQARQDLGRALLRKGDYEGAMACLERTTALPPDRVEKWHALGQAFFKAGNLLEAIACFRQTLSLNPRFVEAWAELGMAFFNNGQTQEAEASWQRALDINPAQPQVQNNLASVLATASDPSLRNGTRAMALAEEANQLTEGGNAIILATLAAAYAEAGRYDAATVTARKARNLAETQKDMKLAGTVQEAIKLYEAGRPMRQTK